MALFFGVCFFLYFLKLSAGKGFCQFELGGFLVDVIELATALKCQKKIAVKYLAVLQVSESNVQVLHDTSIRLGTESKLLLNNLLACRAIRGNLFPNIFCLLYMY